MKSIPLLLICLTACLLCTDTTSGLSLHQLSAPLLTAFVLSWPVSFLPEKIRAVVGLLIGEGVISVCLVDCYCQEFLMTPVTPQILSTVLLSDSRETHEFFSSFIGWYVLAHWRISAELLLAIILPLSYLPCINRKLSFKCGRRGRWVTVAFFSLCFIYEALPTYRFLQLFGQRGDLQRMEGLIFRHYHEEVPTPLHRIAFAYYSLNQSSRVLDGIMQATYSASVDSCSYLSPHIVLVIGESYNKHHSSLYGYPLPTTPRQQERKDKGEMYVFTDVVAPWNITSNVFLDMFSLWENGMEASVSDYPLFPILFRRAGFEVNFFSNQYLQRGFHKGATNQAGNFFLAKRKLSDSLFSYRNTESSKYDMGLVEQIESAIGRERQAYTLDIIHLIGQHFDYSERYPQSLATFAMDDYQDRNLDAGAKEILMHYDNATLYNDMVTDSLLSMYERENAIVVYIADHGEEVYDDSPVHGRLFQEPTAAQARLEFEVPMWIWCSELYRSSHPDMITRIGQSVGKPFMTDGLPQLLLYLAGISCKWNDDSRNLLSPFYQCKKRVIGGSADYDLLMRQ